MRVWRDYNLSGGRCAHLGCQKWGRFRYIKAESLPPYDEFADLPGYCTIDHWRKAQPKAPRAWPHPGRGELHPRSKLKNHQVADIKNRLAQGESNSAIARAYGVTRQTIGYIKSGKVWSHLKLENAS